MVCARAERRREEGEQRSCRDTSHCTLLSPCLRRTSNHLVVVEVVLEPARLEEKDGHEHGREQQRRQRGGPVGEVEPRRGARQHHQLRELHTHACCQRVGVAVPGAGCDERPRARTRKTQTASPRARPQRAPSAHLARVEERAGVHVALLHEAVRHVGKVAQQRRAVRLRHLANQVGLHQLAHQRLRAGPKAARSPRAAALGAPLGRAANARFVSPPRAQRPSGCAAARAGVGAVSARQCARRWAKSARAVVAREVARSGVPGRLSSPQPLRAPGSCA